MISKIDIFIGLVFMVKRLYFRIYNSGCKVIVFANVFFGEHGIIENI